MKPETGKDKQTTIIRELPPGQHILTIKANDANSALEGIRELRVYDPPLLNEKKE